MVNCVSCDEAPADRIMIFGARPETGWDEEVRYPVCGECAAIQPTASRP